MRFGRHAQCLTLRLSFAALTLMISSCGRLAGMDADEARHRIRAAVPAGWRLAQATSDADPFETFDGPNADHRGRKLVFEGPSPVSVEGYYCGDIYCERPAREALEIWIMPSGYRSRRDAPDLQGWRSPELLFNTDHIQVFALATRDYGDIAGFDRAYNGSSRETSAIPPGTGSDLPLSWNEWRRDILAALRAPEILHR